jgi:hypothetical protein
MDQTFKSLNFVKQEFVYVKVVVSNILRVSEQWKIYEGWNDPGALFRQDSQCILFSKNVCRLGIITSIKFRYTSTPTILK